MKIALAFLDWGRWVADCPECKDAQLVYIGEDGPPPDYKVTLVRREMATCANGHVFGIVMPEPSQEKKIMAALATHPPEHQQWYPEGHQRAEEAGLPVGQTPAEAAERAEVAGKDPDQERELREALAKAGITVNDDGTFSGQL